MARRPHDLEEPRLEFIDDGLTDQERSASLTRWLRELDDRPALNLTVRASETLAELRAEGEL